MERKDLIQAVAESSRIENLTELYAMTQNELVEKVILPFILGTPRGNHRYNRISGEYMKFVAQYGQMCVELDRESGELLMEFALQRLSKGAVVHKGIHLINILPEAYRQYTSAYDEPGLMGPECWEFILNNLVFCVKNLSNAAYRNHAEQILWGLFGHLNPDGSTIDGYMWNRAEYVGASEAQAYEWAEKAAVECFGVDAIAQHFALRWRQHKAFYKRHMSSIHWETAFFPWLDLDNETFYTGAMRFLYRVLGLYTNKTKKRILAEISAEA